MSKTVYHCISKLCIDS